MREDAITRRAILAAIGTSTIGSTATVRTAANQDRDPSQYDRPRTITRNGVEFTQWDCSRIIINGPPEIAQILVSVQYNGISQPEGIGDTVSGTLDIRRFGLPVDIRVNDHLNEFDPLEGSLIIEGVSIYTSINDRSVSGNNQGQITSIGWPLDEWDCYEIRQMTPPEHIIRAPDEIPYSYEAKPY
ncbi:hypothetical protein [Natronorubrum aibiense]|uniref:hypothetical protein n=1 Tax=Natronorubrum aibiense TaxID=348826 RepID=UPI001D036657|nr:hypothetical protein [Natronorubrum aibiense]